jgi:hypothetical protein
MSAIPYNDFIELILKFGARPQRPEEDEFPGLSDGIWELAERCWDKDPKARPSATQIHDAIQLLMMDLPKTIPASSLLPSTNSTPGPLRTSILCYHRLLSY